eukprot:CAMPEP_0197516442 /NCGR_PEP_ID=MMETSP1318-20131121/1324_1 /TAXON_ID=552666 /ORGANISM="Partenskyella glossopodia, Strain RCC365" /LENGTH=158 /DNA_ID=CAMNT_0043065191 /DNA_START=354 /DNA_END=830 /DNA_ORIENTATION=-
MKLPFNDQVQLLADYVGAGSSPPANMDGDVIPITAPILMPGTVVEMGNIASTFRLILPPDFEMNDAPKPLDGRLEVVEIPEHVCAVQAVINKNNVEEQRRQLIETLKKDGHATEGSWQMLHYRSPWFNPMFNADEISIGLRKYVHCRENRNTLWCTEY